MSLNEITGISDWERRLTTALARRHHTISSPQVFLEVLGELTTPFETATADEIRFLVEHTDLEAGDFAPSALTAVRAEILVGQTLAERQLERDALTTADVAARLGMQASNVRRLVREGRLLTAGRTRAGAHLFPRWQFTPTGIVPGIRDVLAVLPSDYHPLDVEEFMTTPHEDLGERSPVDWLADGGEPQRVVDIADELAWV